MITAIYVCVRCILYGGTKCVIASSTRKQGSEVLLKIKDELMVNAPLLRNEIQDIKIGANDAVIYFKNSSWARVAVASDSSRGMRANVLVVDEFRLVSKEVIDMVLRKFLTAARRPAYLNKPEYSHMLPDRNTEIFLSSAWLKSSWSYEKFMSYAKNMLQGRQFYVCSIPYQVSIMDNLLSREQVEDEMSESDFNEMTWRIEMGAEWYADTDGKFFNFNEISNRRKLQKVMFPLSTYKVLNISIPELEPKERRIMSVDIALLASRKHQNDASSVFINRMIPNNGNRYITNIFYAETFEGLTADELALTIMRYYYQYKCTDLVIDGSGVGQPIIDLLMKEQYDAEYGEEYAALNCCNNDDIASRCKVQGAKKAIWTIKANANSNTEMALNLRSGFQNGKINLPVSEFEAEEYLKSIKGFSKLSLQEQTRMKMAYVQTTMLIYELINLEHEAKGTNIKISERSGMRKDRYSSLEYNFWVATQIERSMKPKRTEGNDFSKLFYVRAPKKVTRFS